MFTMHKNLSLCCIIMFLWGFFGWYWIASTNPIDLLGVWFEHGESGSSQCMYVCSCFKSKNLLLSSYSAVHFHAFPCFQSTWPVSWLSWISIITHWVTFLWFPNYNICNVEHTLVNHVREWGKDKMYACLIDDIVTMYSIWRI